MSNSSKIHTDITYDQADDQHLLIFIRAVRKGFSYATFIAFANNTPFTMSEWSIYLNMSERTIQRYKKERKVFDPIYSEKILQITLLYNSGKKLFGSQEKFNTWLETANIALGGTRPKDLLDNSFGISILKDQLIRIEHGILA